MAAFTTNGNCMCRLHSNFLIFILEFVSVVVFAPNESKPSFLQKLNLPSPVNSALFLPLDEVKNSQVSWQKRAVLYFATDNQVCNQTDV
jgi:hypothetical protein